MHTSGLKGLVASHPWLFGILAALLVFLVAGGLWFNSHFSPLLRDRAEAALASRFDSEVEIHDFHADLFTLHISGAGLVLRHHGRRDVPPLISIRRFSAEATLMELLRSPLHVRKVKIEGLSIQVPPRQHDTTPGQGPAKRTDIPLVVDELDSNDAELVIIPGKPGKSPHVFEIHRLVMHGLGRGQAASYNAVLTNPTPPGEIHATHGRFGPWNRDDPSSTPVEADFTFEHADLSVFNGIAGILSSTGKFGGPLNQLEVNGQTTTPDFTVTVGGHPLLLKTEYHATVDGSNGDTILHPVIARFLHSTLTCIGGVVKPDNGPGKAIRLDVTSDDARLEDLLYLAVKADKPLMTGIIDLHTKFDLPPGDGDIIDRLVLDGEFGIDRGRFTEFKIRQKVKSLSRRGQGRANDEDAGSEVSQLKGRFLLRKGVITFRNLTFAVQGAEVELAGTYGLRDEALDFEGKLRLQAKLSQTITGFKSVLIKPFDPFFRKNGKTVLPIKIQGSRQHPSFGLNF